MDWYETFKNIFLIIKVEHQIRMMENHTNLKLFGIDDLIPLPQFWL